MRRTLHALLFLALVPPSALTAADRPATIAEFLLPTDRPWVIAHRGFSVAAPENTLAAVRAAIEVGADMVEIDVTLSADGHLVVLHDETVDRTTDGRGAVSDFTLTELRRLDAGSWFSPRFAGERLPTLEAVLIEVDDRILLNLEIKSEAVDRGIVDRVADTIRDHEMADQVIVSSFSPTALEQVRAAAPEIRTAVLFNRDLHGGEDPVAIVRELGASAFNIKRARLTRRMLQRCRDNGVPVAVYTVNSPRRFRKLSLKGVHAVFTDDPGRMVEVLEQKATTLHRSTAMAPRAISDAASGTGTETETGTGSATAGLVMGVP